VKNRAAKWVAPILEDPDEERRDEFVQLYFTQAKPDQVVAILKPANPQRIVVAKGSKDDESPFLEYKQRWVNQYNFYLNDRHWGRMFVRVCPSLPFPRICLNKHHWLAERMRQEGMDFRQCTKGRDRPAARAFLEIRI
jgi:hypothetical protein